MGSKIKPRQQKKPRSLIIKDMITRGGAGPMRDRRERRPKDKRNDYWSDPRNSNEE